MVLKSIIRYYLLIIIWDISNGITCIKFVFIDKKHKMEKMQTNDI